MAAFHKYDDRENTAHVCTENHFFYKHVLLVWYKCDAMNGTTKTLLLEFGPRTQDGAAFIALLAARSYVNIFEKEGFVNIDEFNTHHGRRLVSVAYAPCIKGIWFSDQSNVQKWAKANFKENEYQLMVNDCRHFANNVYNKLTGKNYDIHADQPWLFYQIAQYVNAFGPFA